MTAFPDQLKAWRKQRRMSQLTLALEADVSARHVSFLETGRSRPSAEMIAHLSDVMDLPMDARNRMMRAGGFAPRYGATPLDAASMAPIRDAMAWTLARHAPYPGFALDRLWQIVQMNGPAKMLFEPLGLTEGQSLLGCLGNPDLQSAVENWPQVAHYTALRLRAESAAVGGVPELDAAIEMLAPMAQAVGEDWARPSIPTVYRFGGQRLSLFGTIAHFSTVSDETLDALKVELFFPADTESAALLTALADS